MLSLSLPISPPLPSILSLSMKHSTLLPPSIVLPPSPPPLQMLVLPMIPLPHPRLAVDAVDAPSRNDKAAPPMTYTQPPPPVTTVPCMGTDLTAGSKQLELYPFAACGFLHERLVNQSPVGLWDC